MSIPYPAHLCGLLARGPLFTAVRHKARINIQKPKLPHWRKAQFQRLTEPKFPATADLLSSHRGCYLAVEVPQPKENNPLEVLISTKLREVCDSSELMVFFHRNSMSMTEIHKAWQMLKRSGFTYHKLFNNVIARHAFAGSHLEPVLQLCQSHTSLITCQEPRVAQLLKLQKKLPQLVVLGGVVEGRFMSAAHLQDYSKLPDLATQHAQLSSLLAGPAAVVSASLNHHQAALVRSLAEYARPAAIDGAGVSETEGES